MAGSGTKSKAEETPALRKMVEDVKICMFTTIDDHGIVTSRPMSTIKVDEKNDIWFFTNEYSETVHDVSKENTVYLIYSHPGKNTYIHIKGVCKVAVGKKRMKELWNPLMKAWFPEGLDDPKL